MLLPRKIQADPIPDSSSVIPSVPRNLLLMFWGARTADPSLRFGMTTRRSISIRPAWVGPVTRPACRLVFGSVVVDRDPNMCAIANPLADCPDKT